MKSLKILCSILIVQFLISYSLSLFFPGVQTPGPGLYFQLFMLVLFGLLYIVFSFKAWKENMKLAAILFWIIGIASIVYPAVIIFLIFSTNY